MSNRAGVLNVDVGESTKREAALVLDQMGLNMTTAVKMFLNQVVVERRLPFQPATANASFLSNLKTAQQDVSAEKWSDEEIMAAVEAVRYGQ